MVEETAKEGNRELAKYLGCSLRTVSRRIKEMKKVGVVFEQYRGRPPQKVNCWFPSVVQRYLAAVQRSKNEDS